MRTDRETVYVIGGTEDCRHLDQEWTYLGQMGTSSFYRCGGCAASVVVG